MTGFVAVLALAAFILKVVDLVRYVAGGDANGVATQLLVWLLGVLGLWWISATSLGPQIAVGGRSLAGTHGWGLIFYGLLVSSLASVVKDLLKSLDASQSAAVPPLLRVGGRR